MTISSLSFVRNALFLTYNFIAQFVRFNQMFIQSSPQIMQSFSFCVCIHAQSCARNRQTSNRLAVRWLHVFNCMSLDVGMFNEDALLLFSCAGYHRAESVLCCATLSLTRAMSDSSNSTGSVGSSVNSWTLLSPEVSTDKQQRTHCCTEICVSDVFFLFVCFGFFLGGGMVLFWLIATDVM